MIFLDNKKVIAQINLKSLGKVNLKYISAGDVKRYFEIDKDKNISDRNYVEKILFNQLLSPEIKLNDFQKINDAELTAVAKAFIEAEKLLFTNYNNTGNFFKDFRNAINHYLEKTERQNKKFVEPYKKEAEKSFQKVIETIKSIKKIVPKVSLPLSSALNKPEELDISFKPPGIVREENNWQRHKETMDSLDSSLKAQNEILTGQKRANRSNTRLTIIITIIVLIPSCFAAYYGYKGLEFQKNVQNENIVNQEYPFFKYSYDTNAKVFKIDSYDYVRINEVKWSFPKYEKEKIVLYTINDLAKNLSWYEIRDYYAMELSQKLTTKRKFKLTQDDAECLFFAYAQEGIPVVVEINYDLREKQGQKSKDLVLINRLDTKFSSINFIEKINADEQLLTLLNKYKENLKYAYETTIEMVNKFDSEHSSKIYDGTCEIIINQPGRGF